MSQKPGLDDGGQPTAPPLSLTSWATYVGAGEASDFGADKADPAPSHRAAWLLAAMALLLLGGVAALLHAPSQPRASFTAAPDLGKRG
jgi:hypothetical protein